MTPKDNDYSIFHSLALVYYNWDSTRCTAPTKSYLPGESFLGKRNQGQALQSDLPKYTSLNDLLDSVYYRDIELFYLKDPQSNRDVLCAIIEFRNLKGRPEGADG
jgi:hypothetical protein